jgi:hypothetical protein
MPTPVPRRYVSDAKGHLLCQIEYYHDTDPYKPTAFAAFLDNMQQIKDEFQHFPTHVFDSASFMELSARKWDQYGMNPTAKDPRKWYSTSTMLLEENLWQRPAGIPGNVVTICHVDEDKDEMLGNFVRNPALPGKLRKRMASAYGEFYYLFVRKNPVDGTPQRVLLCHPDGQFHASSLIDAPPICEPSYTALWQGHQPWCPIHVLLYGDSGTGKSTLAATFPKPIRVFHFDPYNKDVPYLRLGQPSPLLTA